MGAIYTIGYGNIDVDDLFYLLRKFRVEILIDIRSRPYSKHAPAFRKQNLEKLIIGAGMSYIYLGGKLGGISEDKRFYDRYGKVDYSLLSEDPDYLDGIREIIDLSRKGNVCLMCAEAEPERCHRSLLVSETLWRNRILSLHILRNGATIRHGDLRMKFEPRQGDLFDDVN